MITELKPLQTYPFDSTGVHDINNGNQAVGQSFTSFGPLRPSMPLAQATLWDESGTPTPLAEGPNRSEALRINDAGNVLYRVASGPIEDYGYQSFVGPVGAAVALDSLIPGEPGASAIDLNDHSLLLGSHVNAAGFAESFLYDFVTGSFTVLPMLENRIPSLVGVDNAGRVLATVVGPPTAPPGCPPEYPDILYWLPAGAAQWQPIGIRTYGFIPKLSKTGLVMASVSRVNPSASPLNNQYAGYLDLNAPGAMVFKELPSLLPPGNTGLYASWAGDANAAGAIVGQVFYPGGYPMRYDIATGKVEDLSPHFPANWRADIGLGVNDNGFIVGGGYFHVGSSLARLRAWSFNPVRDSQASAVSKRFSEAVRILIGLIGGGDGVVLPVGGPPRPVDPGILSLLNALPPVQKEALVGLLLGALAGTMSDHELRRELVGIERRLLKNALAHLDQAHRE